MDYVIPKETITYAYVTLSGRSVIGYTSPGIVYPIAVNYPKKEGYVAVIIMNNIRYLPIDKLWAGERCPDGVPPGYPFTYYSRRVTPYESSWKRLTAQDKISSAEALTIKVENVIFVTARINETYAWLVIPSFASDIEELI